MSATTRSLLNHPREQYAHLNIGAAVLAALLFVLGFIGHPSIPWAINVLGLGVLATLTISQAIHAWHLRQGQLSKAMEGAIAALIMILAFSITRALQGVGVELYQLLYFTLALLVALASKRTGFILVATAIGVEIGAQVFGTSMGQAGELELLSPAIAHIDWTTLVIRCGTFALFGTLANVIHGAEITTQRRKHQREVEQERANLVKEAREFRLFNSDRLWETASAGRERAEQLIMTDAIEAVHHSTYVSLRLLKTSLSCHTCVLLWFDDDSRELHIKELVSDSDSLLEVPIEPARGVIGGISRRREPVNLRDLKQNYRGIPYYMEPQGVKHFLGVPVIEAGHLSGVLCVDRKQDDPFDALDVDMLEEAAAYILRAVQNERLFASIEKSKYELGRFFEASRRLNAVLTPEDVWREALASVAEISEFDFAAFTTYDSDTDAHTITQVALSPTMGKAPSGWVNETFKSNAGWVSMVVKNRHYLPYGGHVRDASPLVFAREHTLGGMQSMVVLPLIAQDQTLGTLVIGHHKPNLYTTERREMLEVVSNQVAISLQNANLYAQMETMATRDALTSLPNRRSFMTRLSEAMARHKRSGRTFGVILTDIDKFKSVNDTYGHPVGDEVLRQVARAFRETLRETDMPARYGGEEFIVLLEETDMEGCEALANRLRVAVSELVFQSEQGPFQCTISMGIGIWPDDNEDAGELIELADQALYYSKKNGRNQVNVYNTLVAEGKIKGSGH